MFWNIDLKEINGNYKKKTLWKVNIFRFSFNWKSETSSRIQYHIFTVKSKVVLFIFENVFYYYCRCLFYAPWDISLYLHSIILNKMILVITIVLRSVLYIGMRQDYFGNEWNLLLSYDSSKMPSSLSLSWSFFLVNKT